MRFTSDLEPEWALPDRLRPGIPDVADLTTINVVGETAWICSYPDDPIARIDGDTVTAWTTPEMQVSHLLLDDHRAALISDRTHPTSGDNAVLGHLDEQRFVATASASLQLPDGITAAKPHLLAQGPALHSISPGGRWSVIDLDGRDPGARP